MMNEDNRPSPRGVFLRCLFFILRFAGNGLRLVLIFLVRLYRVTLSPAKMFLCGPRAQCRFTPSCSEYGLEALQTHGAVKGSWLAFKRVCRCHPWGDCGHDPVPKAEIGNRKSENRLAHGC